MWLKNLRPNSGSKQSSIRQEGKWPTRKRRRFGNADLKHLEILKY